MIYAEPSSKADAEQQQGLLGTLSYVDALPCHEILDRIGFTLWHLRVLALCWLCWLGVGAVDVTLELTLEKLDPSRPLVAQVAGSIAGLVVFALLGDNLGRRSCSLGCVVGLALSLATIKVCLWYSLLLPLESLVGLASVFSSGLSLLTNTLLAEAVAAAHRGRALNLLHVAWQLGSWGMHWMGINDEATGQQLVTALFGVLVLPVFWWMPESLHWVLNQNVPCVEVLEGRAMVSQMLQWAPTDTLPSVWAISNPRDKHADVRTPVGQMRHVLSRVAQPEYAQLLSALAVLWFVQAHADHGAYSEIDRIQGQLEPRSPNMRLTAVVHCSKFAGAVLSVLVVESIGRRRLMLVCLLLSGILIMAVGLLITRGWSNELVISVALLSCMSAQAQIILTTYTVEVLPIDFRNLAGGLLHAMGVLGVVVNTVLSPIWFPVHPQAMFVANGLAFLLGTILVTLFRIETAQQPLT